MNRVRLTAERIEALLHRSEDGAGTEELCREFGVSRATVFRIKERYGRPERLLELEREARRSQRSARRLQDEIGALQHLLRSLLPSLDARHDAAALLASRCGLSERRACALVGLHRSTLRYREQREGRAGRAGRRSIGEASRPGAAARSRARRPLRSRAGPAARPGGSP